MSSIAEWVRTLIVVVLLGNLVEFLLPKSDMKRYAGLVVGLVILAVMLAPVSRWVSALEHAGTPLALASWTNTGSGFRQVTINEELHQAEAIVLTYRGVRQCQITEIGPGRFRATIAVVGSVSPSTLQQYVADAIQVTTGAPASVEVIRSQVPAS